MIDIIILILSIPFLMLGIGVSWFIRLNDNIPSHSELQFILETFAMIYDKGKRTEMFLFKGWKNEY